VLEELTDRCTICAMLDKGASEEWRSYKTMQCRAHQGVRGVNVDKFRRLVVDGGGSYSYRRCWVNQKYCATGEDVGNRC
jgi:hypothetical protein